MLEMAFVAVLALMQAPSLPSNPRAFVFMCPDHDRDDGHELDLINDETGEIVQTIHVGDPPVDADGWVTVTVNVQPIAFGVYRAQARATVGAVKSPNSDLSDPWQRAPGKPGKPIVLGGE